MSTPDSSTRTIAGVAAVIAILALLLSIVQSSESGLIAQFAGTTKAVSEQNDEALLGHISAANQRIDALEKKIEELGKQQPAQAAAATPE